jgi:hypothetical protein
VNLFDGLVDRGRQGRTQPCDIELQFPKPPYPYFLIWRLPERFCEIDTLRDRDSNVAIEYERDCQRFQSRYRQSATPSLTTTGQQVPGFPSQDIVETLPINAQGNGSGRSCYLLQISS